MGKYVSEIFGYPPTNKDSIASNLRNEFQCPFINDKCDPINKKSNLTDDQGNLLLEHQTGACSVFYKNKGQEGFSPSIICPYRFFEKDNEERNTIFEYIKNRFFYGKQLFFVKEIGLGSFGRADGMLVEPKTLNYAHIEFQADATTGTRALVQCVKDFFDCRDITNNSYSYGLNSKASIKSSSLQMIDKGFLFEHFDRKSIWIMQDTLFNVLSRVYNIKMTEITNSETCTEDCLIFVVVGLIYVSKLNKYQIQVRRCYSTSSNKLQQAISQKTPIEESTIISNILNKISNKKYEIV